MIRWFKEKLGWITCSNCGQFRKPRWVKDIVLHPEEPPLFCHYEMPCCGVRTEVLPTMISERAAKSLGYKDFDEYMKVNFDGKEE